MSMRVDEPSYTTVTTHDFELRKTSGRLDLTRLSQIVRSHLQWITSPLIFCSGGPFALFLGTGGSFLCLICLGWKKNMSSSCTWLTASVSIPLELIRLTRFRREDSSSEACVLSIGSLPDGCSGRFLRCSWCSKSIMTFRCETGPILCS
jgi:hypothetical protein